ncbi:MAG: squalene--hopene cyclase [Verrucomicrobiae bacterium]|nr:squalene--hopene cyclase [Verrucomicrobiae bacterium]
MSLDTTVQQQLDRSIRSTQQYLLGIQKSDGHWVGELEGDTILETEYMIFLWYIGRRDKEKFRKLANYLLLKQQPNGVWSIYPGGPTDVSASVKAYFALKLAGHNPNATYMRKAREAILKLGGIAKVNTFTKLQLALMGQCDWRAVPAIPPETILIPQGAYFNIYEMSAWSRAMIIPLSIIWAHRPTRPVPEHLGISELYVGGRENFEHDLSFDKQLFTWRNVFLAGDKLCQFIEKMPAKPLRKMALRKAEAWMLKRLEKSDGVGAIFPGIIYSSLALITLGYPMTHPKVTRGIKQVADLEIEEKDSIRVQPCFSPVWDTAWSITALRESGVNANDPVLQKAGEWLLSKETRAVGDWYYKTKHRPAGGWYFEYRNDWYPDVDDTCMVVRALAKVKLRDESAKRAAMKRGTQWILSMQNTSGGWASFDKDNDHEIYAKVPFADHNAMLDPACTDITARILETFKAIDFPRDHECIRKAFKFIKREQKPDGSWFGRWGVNYLYGTWEALCGLSAIGTDMDKPFIRRAVAWFKSVQNADGGWGETPESYADPENFKAKGPSTASQTAWALLGLLAAGEAESIAVERGIQWLMQRQNPDGTWTEDQFTGTGFPKVFYLRYHLYRIYFPLLALSTYYQAKHFGRLAPHEVAQPLELEARSKRVHAMVPLRQAVVDGWRALRGNAVNTKV